MTRGRRWALVSALACAGPRIGLAAPPPEPPRASAPELATAILEGRVREAGPSRAPVSGAVVIVVDAPAEVRPGKPAELPLDPDAVAWMHRTETDAEGRFALPAVPIGSLRVIVVAGGYVRLEQWAELDADPEPLELHLRPDRDGAYRTEVVVDRRAAELEVEADHQLDGQAARHYPGSGDDPLLAALNLPGLARSPGGLGMFAFRGGDPTEVGMYLDGHPVPRVFHVIPIAAVLAPPMVARLELSPGNYAANYGGFGGGLVTIDSRPGRREGIHGEAHMDLFDVGGTVEGAVGPGSIHLGLRRSHAGDVLRLIDLPQLTAPNFWDYFGRFDYPLGQNHALTIRALGAGDRLLLEDYFDLRANFHRFDLEYRYADRDWAILVSPSLRLDASNVDVGQLLMLRRNARIYSLRAAFRWQPLDAIALEFGVDVVVEHWRRRQNFLEDPSSMSWTFTDESLLTFTGHQMRFGAWLALPARIGDWRLIPSLRANVFDFGATPELRYDPRIDLRGPLSRPVQLVLAAGMYAIPVVGARDQNSLGWASQGGTVSQGFAETHADIPDYLITYFDPGIDGEVEERWTDATHVIHASAGFEAALPWDLDLRAIGFWRGSRPVEFVYGFADAENPPNDYGRRRSIGLELLLRRTLAPGVVDGWLGYTLLWARVEDYGDWWRADDDRWLPAVFDQRHNFVALLSFALPRDFRVGLRFRLSSGNPETPVTGRDIVETSEGVVIHVPLRGPRGTSYQPMFHQLDIRIDKSWELDRASVAAYFDVQNVYNHLYPEVWIYSPDWSARQAAFGLPIYPSIGVQVRY